MEHAHTPPDTDPACAMATGEAPPEVGPRTLVAIFESPVAEYLLRFGLDLGYRTILVEPDPTRLAGTPRAHGDRIATGVEASFVDAGTDVVVTDHDRPELGPVLRNVLALPARWVGVMGGTRHAPPHLEALRSLGVDEAAIKQVHRPIGLNIGSKTPAEIALSTLAGLIADRNHRPGGFTFA